MGNITKLELYTPGNSRGESTFSDGFNFVSRVSTDGMQRLIERIDLEEDRIPVKKVPVGGPKGTEDFTSMFSRAEQGYKRLFNMSEAGRMDPSKVFDRLGFDSSEDAAARLVNDIFTPDKLEDPNATFDLSVAFSLRNTIQSLVQTGEVSFYHLGITPKDGDHCFNLTPSFWRCNLSLGTIWDTTRDMGKVLNRAVWQTGLVEDTTSLFKAAHFLGAATSMRTIE